MSTTTKTITTSKEAIKRARRDTKTGRKTWAATMDTEKTSLRTIARKGGSTTRMTTGVVSEVVGRTTTNEEESKTMINSLSTVICTTIVVIRVRAMTSDSLIIKTNGIIRTAIVRETTIIKTEDRTTEASLTLEVILGRTTIIVTTESIMTEIGATTTGEEEATGITTISRNILLKRRSTTTVRYLRGESPIISGKPILSSLGNRWLIILKTILLPRSS
jgi:hypothetical protein